MGFEFDSETRRRLGYRLIDHIDRYFASLPERPVQLPAEERTFEPLADLLPEVGADAERVLDDLCTELVERGFHVPSANYFGLMNPTPAYMAVLAEALVAALNPQLATMARSQLAARIEQETVRWIGERVWPERQHAAGRSTSDDFFEGVFTSGGNEANFCGLALALAHHFPRAIEEGVASVGAQPVAYTSSEAHHSLDKSCGLLGMGRRALRRLPVDARLQLDPARLQRAIAQDLAAGLRPFCVAATAGTTNSGAVDDLEALAAICRRHRLWLHVDGAYGAAAVFSARHRHLVRGIELADSVVLDPHKWLAMPYAAGIILTRHPQALRTAFAVFAPYMPRPHEGATTSPAIDNSLISPQWTRRANALKLWLTLRVHGRQAYEEHMDRQLRLARGFAAWVEGSPHFELAAPQVLPIVNLRVRRPGASEAAIAAANLAVVEAVTRDGRRWISATEAGGRSVIRMMVISYLTGEKQLAQLQEVLTKAATELRP